jgi:hypothetical protein
MRDIPSITRQSVEKEPIPRVEGIGSFIFISTFLQAESTEGLNRHEVVSVRTVSWLQ